MAQDLAYSVKEGEKKKQSKERERESLEFSSKIQSTLKNKKILY